MEGENDLENNADDSARPRGSDREGAEQEEADDHTDLMQRSGEKRGSPEPAPGDPDLLQDTSAAHHSAQGKRQRREKRKGERIVFYHSYNNGRSREMPTRRGCLRRKKKYFLMTKISATVKRAVQMRETLHLQDYWRG